MTGGIDLVAIFGPTAERTIDGAAYREDTVPELVVSTGARCRFDQPVIIGHSRMGTAPVDRNSHVERIEIAHPMLSREHACVSPVGRRASVVDLGSTNGTIVVSPERGPLVCTPGRLVLIETGWRVELGGAVWITIEPQARR